MTCVLSSGLFPKRLEAGEEVGGGALRRDLVTKGNSGHDPQLNESREQ